jgi:hypothetical protein
MNKHALSFALTVALSCAASIECRAQFLAAYPPGVYSTWDSTDQISTGSTSCVPTSDGKRLLADTGVVGILLFAAWPDVDSGTTGPNMNWSNINQRLTEAKTCGLSAALTLATALTDLPVWVQQQPGIQRVTLTGFGTVPVFWDPIFNADRVKYIQAAAADIATLPAAVSGNIVSVCFQPFGAVHEDWNIPHTTTNIAEWKSAGYTTALMLNTAKLIIDTTAAAFPTKNMKLPVQDNGNLDAPNNGVLLDQEVLAYAFGKYGKRFYVQLNFLNSTKSPPNCVSPCALDQAKSPFEVFNLLRQYRSQGYGVGIQDVDASVDGAGPGNGCAQNGASPCTPCDTPPVQYAAVSQGSWNIAATYKPTFWEVWNGDAMTEAGHLSTCQLTAPEGAAMIQVFAAATAQMRGYSASGPSGKRTGVARGRRP